MSNPGKALQTLGSAFLNIMWPYELVNEKWLLYPASLKFEGHPGTQCIPSGSLNPLKLQSSSPAELPQNVSHKVSRADFMCHSKRKPINTHCCHEAMFFSVWPRFQVEDSCCAGPNTYFFPEPFEVTDPSLLVLNLHFQEPGRSRRSHPEDTGQVLTKGSVGHTTPAVAASERRKSLRLVRGERRGQRKQGRGSVWSIFS